MAQEQEGASIEVDAEKKILRFSGKKMAELIAILSLFALGWVGWVLFEHRAEAKEHMVGLHTTLKEMVQLQREQTCLMGFPEKDREHKAEFCKRVAR